MIWVLHKVVGISSISRIADKTRMGYLGSEVVCFLPMLRRWSCGWRRRRRFNDWVTFRVWVMNIGVRRRKVP